MTTVIDWSKKPAPWCWVGPAFRAEVELILGRSSPPPALLPDMAGIELTARMVRAKITQKELARRVGCSKSAIGALARGTGSASVHLWARIDRELEQIERTAA